jgi:O-antigen/teichoic acid export membrane protein
MLAQTTCRVAGLNLVARNLCWPSFSFAGMGRHLRFGGFVSVDRGLWGVFSESDKFIGGRLLGNQALGYYAVASQVASLPIQKVSGILNSVAFPAFSRAHADSSSVKVREYLLTATRVLAIAAFPVFLGIGCTAEGIISVLLGEKWLPAAPLLQVLAVVMPFRLLANVFPPLLWGVGRPGISATNYLVAAVAMPVAFYLGVRWGLIGLVLAWLSMYPLVFAVTAYRACRCVEVRLGEYLGQLLRPCCAALVMYLVVLNTAGLMPGESGGWWHLLGQIFLGVATYTCVILLVDRKSLLETLALLKA